MPLRCYNIKTLGFLLILAGSVQAQEFIILNDSLALKSERLDVKMGSLLMGKIKKFSFGDYTIISSKAGGSSGSEKSNLFGTKTESRSTKKLSFVLSSSADTVSVDAESTSVDQSQHQFELTPGLTTGTEQTLAEYNNLLAVITIHGDSSTGWRLIFGSGRVAAKDNAKYETVLTNGVRDIWLTQATSNKDFDFTKPFWFMGKVPAMGFEFNENGQFLCAVQYIGGGSMAAMNPKGCKVWMHRKPNSKMKLVLAAAMTTLLLMQSPASPVH